jgi:dTMP kinase
MPKQIKNFFLTVEGIEGVGKTTAMQFIKTFLLAKKIDFVLSREPGGTVIAEQIRQVLLTLNTEEKLLPTTELLLMFAARAQHIAHVIRPALQANKWVICDRYVDASYAYQGGGRSIAFSYIQQLDDWVTEGLLPNITILLDAPPAIGLERAKNRGPQDRIEQEKIDFFERVRAGYLRRAEQDPTRFRVIDATQSLEVVQGLLESIILEFLPL